MTHLCRPASYSMLNIFNNDNDLKKNFINRQSDKKQSIYPGHALPLYTLYNITENRVSAKTYYLYRLLIMRRVFAAPL